MNALYKVDGATFTTAEADHGKITLNNVPCQQRGTGQTSWPKTYWNCANPGGSSTDDVAMRTAVVALPTAFKTTLGGHSTQLYIMKNSSDFNTYFQPNAWIPNVTGYNMPTEYQQGVSFVFESSGSLDQKPYHAGNMMHEIGHLIDEYTSPKPTTTAGWATKKTATENAMTGTWPGVQSPTCTQVYNSPAICNAYPNTSPWDILKSNFIGNQNEDKEVFAFAFQNCSGNQVYSPGLNNAERSIYMRDVYKFMNGDPTGTGAFWPGGCPWQP